MLFADGNFFSYLLLTLFLILTGKLSFSCNLFETVVVDQQIFDAFD
jgi:hypothetical protein